MADYVAPKGQGASIPGTRPDAVGWFLDQMHTIYSITGFSNAQIEKKKKRRTLHPPSTYIIIIIYTTSSARLIRRPSVSLHHSKPALPACALPPCPNGVLLQYTGLASLAQPLIGKRPVLVCTTTVLCKERSSTPPKPSTTPDWVHGTSNKIQCASKVISKTQQTCLAPLITAVLPFVN